MPEHGLAARQRTSVAASAKRRVANSDAGRGLDSERAVHVSLTNRRATGKPGGALSHLPVMSKPEEVQGRTAAPRHCLHCRTKEARRRFGASRRLRRPKESGRGASARLLAAVAKEKPRSAVEPRHPQ